MTRRRKSRDSEDLEALVRGSWKVPATLLAGSTILFRWVLPTLISNPFLKSMVLTMSWLPISIFGVITVIAFIREQREQSLRGVDTTPSWHAHAHKPSPQKPPQPPDAFRDAWLAANAEKQQAWGGGNVAGESQAKPTEWSIDLLRAIEWKRFEDVCHRFYVTKGIKSNTTSLGADGGIDIKLYQDETDPSKVTSIVQCKAWNQDVGVKPVRELLGVMASEKITKGFFMTTKGFTPDAKEFASGNKITLITGEMLLAMIQRLPEDEMKALLSFATEGDYATPSCPKCGTKMVARESKRGKFWVCQSYPKCRQMINMRG